MLDKILRILFFDRRPRGRARLAGEAPDNGPYRELHETAVVVRQSRAYALK